MGLLDTMASWTGKLNPWAARSPTAQERANSLTTEKVSAGPRGVRIPMFLPYFDDQSAETPAMRKAYRRMPANPVIKAALLGKIFGVSSLDLQIHPATKKSERNRDVAEFCRWSVVERLKGGIPNLLWQVFWGGLIDGFSVVEPSWGLQDRGAWRRKWVIRQAKAKDPIQDFIPVLDEYRNISLFQGLRYNAGQFFDPEDFLTYTHLPQYSLPGGTSDMRGVYGMYWIWDAAWKIRFSGLDKRTYPFLLGEYPRADLKPTVESALAAAKWSNWASVPMGVKVTVLDLAQKGDDILRNALQDVVEMLMLGIALATLQQLTGKEGQQRGDSKVQKTTADLAKWALKAAAESLMSDEEDGLLVRLVDHNFRNADLPRATLGGVEESEYATMITVDKDLHDMGLDLSRDELYERYGRTPPQDESDTIAGAKPTQIGPGMPSEGGGELSFEEFDAELDRFCQTGDNAGKPGPCPDGGGDDPKPSRPAHVAKREALTKKARELHDALAQRVAAGLKKSPQAAAQAARKGVNVAHAAMDAAKPTLAKLTPYLQADVLGTVHDWIASTMAADYGMSGASMIVTCTAWGASKAIGLAKKKIRQRQEAAGHAEADVSNDAVQAARALIESLREQLGFKSPAPSDNEIKRLLQAHAESGGSAEPFRERETSWGYVLRN